MATQVVMPKLSPTMEEGQISRWMKNEGDTVSVGEGLAEIDTDKATMEAQALASGVLRKIFVQAGESVPLGDIIAIIADADEDISELLGQAESGTAAAENKAAMKDAVEAGQDGAQTELAQVVPDGARTQATIRGEAIDGDTGGEADSSDAKQAKQASTADVRPKESSNNGAAASPPNASTTSSNGANEQDGGRIIISPLAARMAAEAGLNLQTLRGSGPNGRIVKRDIEEAMNAPAQAATQDTAQPAQPETVQDPEAKEAKAEPQTAPAPSQMPAVQGASSFRDVPNTVMRRTIATRLTSSIGPVPHFFLTTEIEMDAAMELRRQLNELDAEIKISINDMIIKVAAAALIKHPQVNASYQDQTTRYYDQADIGVAVALEDGLITPVIRAANTKSIGHIGGEIRELAERARVRKLKPEEYTGATFSVSNLGKFGIDEFTAVINPPEAAILAIGAVAPQAVVRDGEIVARQIMRVTMSCDHRVIDGATGAEFLQTFKQILENPLRLLA